LLDAPGNVLLGAKSVGLPRDSVANVTQLVTVDRDYLEEKVGRVPPKTLARVEAGLLLVLDI
jgi:mRNA interferase MazF